MYQMSIFETEQMLAEACKTILQKIHTKIIVFIQRLINLSFYLQPFYYRVKNVF